MDDLCDVIQLPALQDFILQEEANAIRHSEQYLDALVQIGHKDLQSGLSPR